MPDGHGWAADGELPSIEIAAAAEAEFGSFIYNLGGGSSGPKGSFDHGRVGAYLVEGREDVVCELYLSDGRMAHRR